MQISSPSLRVLAHVKHAFHVCHPRVGSRGPTSGIQNSYLFISAFPMLTMSGSGITTMENVSTDNKAPGKCLINQRRLTNGRRRRATGDDRRANRKKMSPVSGHESGDLGRQTHFEQPNTERTRVARTCAPSRTSTKPMPPLSRESGRRPDTYAQTMATLPPFPVTLAHGAWFLGVVLEVLHRRYPPCFGCLAVAVDAR